MEDVLKTGSYYLAKNNWLSIEEEDLPLTKGDKILILKTEVGRSFGQVNDLTGWFPNTEVEEQADANISASDLLKSLGQDVKPDERESVWEKLKAIKKENAKLVKEKKKYEQEIFKVVTDSESPAEFLGKDRLQEEIDSIKLEREGYQREILSAKNELEAVIKEYKEFKEDYESLKDLEQENVRLVELAKKIKPMMDEFSATKERIVDLENSTKLIEMEQEETKEKYDKIIESSEKRHEMEIRGLQEKLDGLKVEYNKAKDDGDDDLLHMQSDVKKLQKQIENHMKNKEKFNAQIDKLGSRLETLRGKRMVMNVQRDREAIQEEEENANQRSGSRRRIKDHKFALSRSRTVTSAAGLRDKSQSDTPRSMDDSVMMRKSQSTTFEDNQSKMSKQRMRREYRKTISMASGGSSPFNLTPRSGLGLDLEVTPRKRSGATTNRSRTSPARNTQEKIEEAKIESTPKEKPSTQTKTSPEKVKRVRKEVDQIQVYTTAKYDWKAKRDDQLSFDSGDSILITRLEQTGWFFGVHIPTFRQGWVPSNYLHPPRRRKESLFAKLERGELDILSKSFDFPKELIEKILTMLDIGDLVKLGLASTFLMNLIEKSEVWKRLCFSLFGTKLASKNAEIHSQLSEHDWKGNFKLLKSTLSKYRMKGYAGGEYSAFVSISGSVFISGKSSTNIEMILPTDGSVPKKVSVPQGSRIVNISVGSDFFIAISDVGGVYTWGKQLHGRLGNVMARFKNMEEPAQLDSIEHKKMLFCSAGGDIGGLISDEGELYTWGGTSCGQNSDETTFVPKLLRSLSAFQIKAVEAVDTHYLALTADGTLFVWGNAEKGVLGTLDGFGVKKPKELKFGHQITDISAGKKHSLAVTSDGGVYSWGANKRGQLGHGTNFVVIAPKLIISEVIDEEHIVLAAAGIQHSLLLSSSGRVFSFGDGEFGQLGHGGHIGVNEPKQIEALTDVTIVSIAAGDNHSVAISDIGEAYTFGHGLSGQLGHGVQESVDKPTVVQALQHLTIVGTLYN